MNNADKKTAGSRDFCIDMTEHFHCLGGECPDTCCMGWQVPVDEETFARYKVLPGLRGKAYRGHIESKEPRRIKKILLRCPFFTSDGICVHQARGEQLLMPIVCRNYPRRVTDYGYFKESTLDLSCPQTAKLFLESPGRRAFIPSKNKQISIWEMENDDKDFLDFLLCEREKILDYIWADGGLDEKVEAIYAYIYNQHDLIARDKVGEAAQVELTADRKKQGIHARYEARGYAFYPITTIDKILLYNVDYGGLVLRVPRFYHFLRRYIKIFSKMRLDEADAYFNEKVAALCGQEHFSVKYRSYFSYLFQQEYLQAYESYSLIREVALCILYLQMMMLFDVIEMRDKGGITPEREAEMLYLLEHNVRHNPYLTKNIYRVIREDVL